MVDPIDIRAGDGYRFLANFSQLQGRVVISNLSPFAARNAACRLEMEGLAGVREAGIGWTAMSYLRGDVVTVQWDGGVDYVIHGEWDRVLELNLRSVVDLGTNVHILRVTVVADGFRKCWPIPVQILEPADWVRRHPDATNEVPVRILDAIQGGPVAGAERPERPADP